jgi:hypothetical protein
VNIATKSFDTKNVEGDYSEFISFSKKALDDMVGEVAVSKRLVTCPFSVRVSENSMSNTFKSVLGENFIKSSPFRSVLESKPTLEFNSDSEEVKELIKLSKVDEEKAKMILRNFVVSTSLVCGVDLYDKVSAYITMTNSLRDSLGLEVIAYKKIPSEEDAEPEDHISGEEMGDALDSEPSDYGVEEESLPDGLEEEGGMRDDEEKAVADEGGHDEGKEKMVAEETREEHVGEAKEEL